MKNKIKFITFSAILLMLTGSFFSCNNKEQPLEPFLTVDETPMIIETAEAGTYSIPVSSNGTWTAVVENADWCILDKSSGNNDGVITVNVAENTRAIARSATIKITSGNLTKSVVINQNAAEEPEEQILLETKWKLEGIMDVETGELKVLEPKDCDECYTIKFDTDRTFSGRKVNNVINYANYEIDYKTGVLRITDIVGTEMGEIGDEYLYSQILWKIRTFTINDTDPRTLHLHYNDGKNYLKFKEIGA